MGFSQVGTVVKKIYNVIAKRTKIIKVIVRLKTKTVPKELTYIRCES